MNKIPGNILSIDIGSVAVSAVELNGKSEIVNTYYDYHHGDASGIIRKLQHIFNYNNISTIVSPSGAYILSEKVKRYDPQASLIKSFHNFYKDQKALLLVGAGRFQLLHFNDDGNFSWSSTNTSCAAGTGSFLDQQARRLDIRSASELSDLADRNTDSLPEIASRCSVFAKTDLIHAQQAGYSLESICDSLCRGLARNLADTLFTGNLSIDEVVFAGGVSKNRAVKRHLEEITGVKLITHVMSEFFPAIGAALIHLSSKDKTKIKVGVTNILSDQQSERKYIHDPLEIKMSSYPDEMKDNDIIYETRTVEHPSRVQIDIYKNIAKQSEIDCYIGLDIGSTSTKGVLTDLKGEIISGFYTYTSGQPLNACRAVLESLKSLTENNNIKLHLRGMSTTGSGRKFIGAILGADMVVDEITTHARAAYELNNDTDTIIEIGGQDAKYTLMKNGRVIFSKMNSVCAAGTGSFIEEQALKMNVSLRDYSLLAENARAPLASDRCTVFMERDINYYVNQGYAKNEILAAVLHSVRDNYLKKVAVESSIGDNICFQGATAKNKALVAAFENKLGKNIFVSRYCHLTGALGAALMLADEFKGESSFRGFDIIKEDIKLHNETCGLCNNNCSITVADIHGDKVAYGFLCGRDYNTEKYIKRNTSGFDLINERYKLLKVDSENGAEGVKIGLPSALNLFEDMSFWKVFFRELGYKTISSEALKDPVANGKQLAGAEFCAPMHAMHAHVKWLEDKADFIFIPAVLESRVSDKPSGDLYCYYTQFSPSVTSLINEQIKQKAIIPLLRFEKGKNFVLKTLKNALDGLGGISITLNRIKQAWETATNADRKQKEQLLDLFRKNFEMGEDLSVVLLGRPYMILSNKMNNNIPDIFGGLGVKSFYQDMLPLDEYPDDDGINDLLKSMPWNFTSKILRAVHYIKNTKGLYPVLITAFKCAPDSFVVDYFQEILDSAGKPYLILQIDEHDSSVGYETRVEAAVRSFRNHYQEEDNTDDSSGYFKVNRPQYKLDKKKTVLFPNWDQIAGRFLAANLRRHGYETHLLDHSQLGIQKAMATNSGQCLPLNIIAHDCIDYIEKKNLDPSNIILWMTETVLSCNIRMYPQYIKTILEKHGNGLEKASVYSGEVAHTEISLDVTRFAYFAYMLSGLMRRTGCAIRPYEVNRGETDIILNKGIDRLEQAFDGKESLNNALENIMPDFTGIKTEETSKPLVAIFGDFFVRDNDIMNQNLIKSIEKYGGEALSTPYSDFYKLIAGNVMRRRSVDTGKLQIAMYRGVLEVMKMLERKYYRHFEPVLGRSKETSSKNLEKNLVNYNIDKYHSGESFDNILKIYHIIQSYPNISLFVQTNPAFCCPSLITEAMKDDIRKNTGIPIVTITYDGTTEDKNDVIAPYLLG